MLVSVAVQCMYHPLRGERSHPAGRQHLAEVQSAQAASVACVEMREQRSELEQGLHLALMSNEQEDGLLQLGHSCVSLNALHDADGQRGRHFPDFAEPRVLQALRREGPPGVVPLQHLPQQVPAQGRDIPEPGMVLHLLAADLLDGRLLPPSLVPARRRRPLGDEGEVAGAHVVQDDPRAPHVHLNRHLLAEDLRSHVQQRAPDKGRVLLLLVEELSQAKVNDLDGGGVLLHHHDVLRL
mmetsp:Transcript_73895/g.228312  ORF Transcript_73895/g.228312 Transcript_73895/m.228312 type:complete len:239 (-) Transcript_73895:928-1644(-)